MCGKKKVLRGIGLLVASLAAALLTQAAPVHAATGINQQLTFQGKVVNSSGVNLADGTYDMEFKIYQDGTNTGSGSTLMWTEDYLVSGSTGMPSTGGITVSSGTFNVNLGSICALNGGTCGAKTNTGVDFNQDTLWLSFQVGNTSSCTVTSSTTSFHTACGGDGEMTPFIRLTAVPYAMNANKVGGLTASQLVQLSPGSPQSGNISLTTGNSVTAGTVNANTLDAATASTALVVGSSNANAITLAKNTTLSSGLTMTLQGNNALTLGSTTNAGGILFQDGTSNNFKVTVTTPALSNSYSLSWATSGATGSQCLQSTSGSTSTVTALQWGSCGSGGSVSLAAVDSAGSANANGATLTGTVLNLNSADATHPGVVNAGSQTFGGNKTFTTTANGVVTLTVKGTTGTAANVLEIFNSNASPTRQDYFDSSGSLNVGQLIQPTSANAIDLGVNSTGTFRTAYLGTSLNVAGTTLNSTTESFTGAGTVQSASGSNLALTAQGSGNVNISSGTGVVNINNSINSNTQVNTGTSTGSVSIGNSSAGNVTVTTSASTNTTVTGGQSTTFAKAWGGTGADQGYSVTKTADGGYAVTGITALLGAGNNDMFIAKYDSSGVLSWNKTWGTSCCTEQGNSIIQTADGGYAITGSTVSFGAGFTEMFVAKYTSSGALSWNKVWGNTGHDEGNSIVQTSDGGYAVTGFTDSFGAGGNDMFVVKYDSSGNVSWNKTWGGTGDDQGKSIVQTSDGGYAVTGYTKSFADTTNGDMFLVKYDSTGTLSWSKAWGANTAADVGASLVQTSDGGYAVTGYTASYSAGGNDMFLAKYDSSGTLSWSKTWGGSGTDQGNSVVQTADGGYAVTGFTANFGAGSNDMFLAKYDSSGTLSWSKTWGNTGDDQGKSIVQTTDGGFAVAGQTNSYGAGGNDMFLVKYDSTGAISGCSSTPCGTASPTVSSPSAATSNPSATVNTPSATTSTPTATITTPSATSTTITALAAAVNAVAVNGSTSISGQLSAGSTTIQGGLLIQAGANTPIALLLQNASGMNSLAFDTTTNTLKVFDAAGSGNYALVMYTGSTAVFAASSGTTQIGTGSGSGGDINFILSNEPDKLVATKSGTLTATYTSSSFAFIRNVSAGAFAAQGNVLKVEDTSSVGAGSLSPNLLYINQNSATATGNLILAQTGGTTTKFQVDTTGTVTIASGQSYTGLGALTLQSASASALTVDSGTTGALNIGTGANAKTITVGNTTGATGLTLQAGSGNITVGAASMTGTGALTIDSASGTTLNIGTGANAHNVTLGNTTGATATTIQGGSGDITLNTSAGNNVIIGSATTDTNMVLFQPDSYSTFDDSGTTCTTTTNQGAFYYNTASGSLRTCRGSGWEDVVTTAALGLQLFGVVPDSGSNPGDLAGIVSGGGPCQVIWTAVNAVSVNSCTAYSGGRKVIVQSTTFSSLTGTAGQFRHICLNGTDNQPALSAAGTETANLPTWSVTAPVLCLADIKFGGTNTMAGGTGGLFDLRTFTTTNKTFTTVNAAVPYGTIIIGAATAGLHALSNAATGFVSGVVVASSGVAQTAAINVIYAYSGPASVKACTTTGISLNAKVQTTATAGCNGYAITGTSTTLGTVAGFAQNASSFTCTSAANCQSSGFFIFSPR